MSTAIYNLRVDYDHDVESPNEHSLLRVVSFSNRHDSFEHPSKYFVSNCSKCNGFGVYGKDSHDYGIECEPCGGLGEVECNLIDHPDVVAVLSYYEHGQCKWMVGASDVPDYGGFDTVNTAGVLVLNTEDESERKWWAELDEDKRTEYMRSTVETYTDWSNGDCYWYDLSTVDGEPVDGCGGFIGFDYLLSELAEVRKAFGIEPGQVAMVGDLAKSI